MIFFQLFILLIVFDDVINFKIASWLVRLGNSFVLKIGVIIEYAFDLWA